MKNSFLFFCLIGLMISQDMGREISLFSDKRSLSVGQAITVEVVEFSQASNVAKTETKRNDGHALSGALGTGLLDFIPEFGASSTNSFNYKGEGKTSKGGTLKTKMSVRIVGKTPSGDLVVEGSRVIQINEEKEIFVLSGSVRPQDVRSDNTIFSYQIYDSKIVFKGKGDVSDAQSKGLISRVLGWIF